MLRSRLFLCLTASCIGYAGIAHADSTVTTSNTVAANAVIYAAGTQSGIAAGASGTTPTAITIVGGSTYFTFSVPAVGGVAQTITLNGGTLNDADGNGAAVSSSYESGYGSISGINAPGAGYLTGVFVGSGGPLGAAPSSLDFTGTGGTSFKTLSPLLDQTFYIGDGLTGDGSGSTQKFYIPTGATTLYLGISDACGYSGGPGCYGDNYGSFSVNASDVTAGGTSSTVTPEPSSLALLGTGVLSAAGMLRRRMTKRQ